MRISDWSSDVCSSDLLASGDRGIAQLLRPCQPVVGHAILLPFAEAYSVVAEQLARARPGDVVDEQALLDAALVEGRQAYLLRRISSEAAIGKLLFANGLSLMRSEEHTSELQSLMRISYAVFCLKKKKNNTNKLNET